MIPVTDSDLLDELESESVYIIRESIFQFKRPALLFSGGKDSVVLSNLIEIALGPEARSIPYLLIDTGHNFPETLKFVQEYCASLGRELLVASVQEIIDSGLAEEPKGPYASRNRLQSIVLKRSIASHRFDAVFGGARRDEERARAKERIFSLRGTDGAWKPEAQRAQLWHELNGQLGKGEHMRIFPLSNWTEIDIWSYIRRENLGLPSIYFSHQRKCVKHSDQLVAFSSFITPQAEDQILESVSVRFRTVGDMTCTAAFISHAKNLDQIIQEIATSPLSERGGRIDDKISEAGMEDRKKEGYF